MLRLDARSSRELRAVLLAIRQADKTVAKRIRQHSKEVVGPLWTKTIDQHTSTALESRALGTTARAAVSNQNVRLSSATVGRRLSGGLSPKEQYGAVEFGANRAARSTYTQRSRKGKPYRVTRHTQRQLRPHNRQGYVFYPSVADVVPRVAALWVQTVVRTFADALEGKTDG